MDCSKFVNFGKKIVGIGLNYKSLLLERNLPMPKTPIVFLKPTSSYITSGKDIEIPKGFKVNEEVELGVVIGHKCKKVAVEKAFDYVAGYCIALDLTETVQLVDVRKNGHPWTFVKGFDTACPVSHFVPMQMVPDPHNVQLWCKVNGKTVQDGNTSEMIFNIPEIISHVSRCMTLEPGDLIITGSPTGVSLIEPGSLVEAGSKSLGVEMQFKVKSDE
ncbi:acylpyruvase FAHD1, mitochondrial [Ischnura elegans]|uniref:acylpyruvase FAHD1, mitochondrial n=1 Tax=Ischnura elegans TaxID=197161 RepID=UPI001ED8AFA1|nr:acylpyruvase FAHD1, mitochondrial [Ischnura elegans]